jgi:hypothetical protein
MEHPQMRQVIRDLVVGWNVMTENEFDAWAVMYEHDNSMIAEVATNIMTSVSPSSAVGDAWGPFLSAAGMKNRLYRQSQIHKDAEVNAELRRRADSIDLTAFFPDGIAYPSHEDLPRFIVG